LEEGLKVLQGTTKFQAWSEGAVIIMKIIIIIINFIKSQTNR